jgi:BASS family bile acid:Na+ symporter
MVYLAGGSTALATVMLVAAMCLTPFILPEILKRFGGITLNIPASYLAVELALIIVLPVVIGVLLNFFSEKVRKKENAWSGIASVCYLMLLFVVVSSNAKTVVLLKTLAVFILISEVGLNIFGYLLAYLTKIIFKQKEAFYPLLFIVGTKEFGIAAAAVETMKLNVAMVIPSAFYAVVQMILSPIMVKLLNIRKLKRSKK